MKDVKFEYKKLGDVAEYINGKSHESLVVNKSDYILINSKFISTSGKSTKFVSTSNLLAQKNDILIVLSDVPNGKAIGKTYIIEDELFKYAVNQRIGLLRTNKNINPKYLNYFLCRNKYFLSFDDGNKQTNLRKNDVLSVMVPIYCLETQNQIAGFLTSIDNIIEQYEEVVKNLEDQKKYYMNMIFKYNILDIKDEANIDDYFNFINGKTEESNVTECGQYQLISLNSIDIKGNIKKNLKRLNSDSVTLKKNDLVIVLSDVAHGNFLGITALIEKDNNYILNQRVACLRSKKEINPKYVQYCILSKQKYFNKMGSGTSQKNLSKNAVLKFNIKVPNIKIQNKISELLVEVDNQISQYNNLILNYKQYKKYYLNKIFSEDQ